MHNIKTIDLEKWLGSYENANSLILNSLACCYVRFYSCNAIYLKKNQWEDMHVCSCISLKLMPVLNTFCWLLAITSYIHNWQLKNYRMCLKLFSDRGFILSLNHIPSSQIISCKSFNKQLFAIWQLLFKLKNQLQWETLT